MTFDVSQFYFKADEPELALWRAVIVLTIRDFKKIDENGENLDRRADAAYFLFSDNQTWKEHRHWVLSNAGIDPEAFDFKINNGELRAKYERLLAKCII